VRKKINAVLSYGMVYIYVTKSYFIIISYGSKILSQWIQIIKNKISRFNYININKIKYKNIRFYS